VLGRAYNVYDEGVNLSLPRKLSDLGFTVLPIDLLPLHEVELGEGFRNMFWDYGRRILEAARYVASHPHLFAVYFSNFSCGPDAFLQTYVEEILGGKPLLTIELDEHGADAGYLTRLEAYSDVLKQVGQVKVGRYEVSPPQPLSKGLDGITLWCPPMHPIATNLFAAALRSAGYKARALSCESPSSFALGKNHCKGSECLPCPATLGSFIQQVKQTGEAPAKHALFMPTAAGPCRFGQYATLQRVLLDRMGWDDVPIVSLNSLDSYDGLDMHIRRRAWWGIVLGDVLFKMATRTRPYEIELGASDKALMDSTADIEEALEGGKKPVKELIHAVRRFEAIRVERTSKPLVGIVGEIYVRCNAFCNQDLVGVIEEAGGEAWLAPVSEWIIYTAKMETILKSGRMNFVEKSKSWLKNRFLTKDERFWYDLSSPFLDERREPPITSTMEAGSRYLPVEFEGEAIITLGRAIEFIHQGAALVVNATPFGCMPGSLTTGIFRQIEEDTGVPIVCMFYDGETDLSTQIRIFLSNVIQAGDSGQRRLTGVGQEHRKAV